MRKLEDHFYGFEIEKFPIKDKFDTEFKFTLHDEEYKVVINEDYRYPNRRFATLTIYTFGVQHYYGEFKAYTSNIQISNPSTSISGYIGGIKIPDEYTDTKFNIMRRVTEEDLKDDPQRFYGHRANGLTNGFYTQKEIIDIFKELAPQILSGKWAVGVESFGNRLDEVILIN